MPAAPWWRPRPVLQRFVADLVADELVRQRRVALPQPRPWPDDLALDADLGVDSLERLALASALAEALHLHESGIEDMLLAHRKLGGWVDVADAGLARFSGRLTFRTSGSCGVPKPCVHPLAALLQETAQHAALFAGRRRVLSAVPSHHIYGFLFNVLLPPALGVAPDALVDLRASTPSWLARNAQPGDLVVGHPEFWQALARTVPKLPPDVVGVTSTAPCPDAVSQAVEAAAIARLVHIYGSSETAGVGWRANWGDAYRLFPHWTFGAAADDRPHVLVRALPDGTHLEAVCQDRLERLGPDTFRVGARHDEAVQVGGVNVFPAHVAGVLRRHPMVDAAAVRLMRPDEGTRLKAYVVPKPGAVDDAALLADLGRWIDSQLAAPERPRAIRLGDRLPVGESGKAADWPLAPVPAG